MERLRTLVRMRDFGCLNTNVPKVAPPKPLLREPERHLAAVSARSLAAAPDERHTPETALIHLDSIVARRSGGDAHLPEGEEVEEGVETLC